ncbi:hypothetical protein [Natronobacterium gregoryi]|uniref:DUF7978 domain-containing protein n=2 Tax=Natronobacterium gregoryi TaxID=44930 RepID=L0AFC5_NATGS|nr:hypothetical protein [Natronobacterium gregoryi]AFZ72124.1 hypothetical protein Natgr_0885 [Natronobacterium gregoryi SP2]ELY62846.1 hypothetical protein C490_16823 [Natronobacterium gregoryi SP2]PLK19273.1 hypothetical protein CYV19_15750 [Natronobacterium gregoryi SP2]SFJ55039.1 hypothetical protein SAMN05443661_13822 [Natronobacterium gregoryi]
MAPATDDRLPYLGGAIAGIAAWLLGYASTYLTVAGDIRDSPLHQFVEAFDGQAAAYEMVGWVFYNTHQVETLFSDVPLIGSHAMTFVGGEDGFTTVLYAVPAGLLLVAGIAIAAYRRPATPTDGLLTGLTAVPGYLLVTIAGIFLFEVTVGGATGAPDALPGIVLAGLVYPVVFAGAGGVIGTLLG